MSLLDRVYDEHAQALFGFVWNWTRSDLETQDVIHELFARLAKDASCLESAVSERALLLQITRRQLIDRQRSESRRKKREVASQAEGELFAPVDDPDRTTFRQALQQCLGELPPMQRSVVYLKLWEEFTFQEIAITLDILPNTAASRYRLGLDKLREQLRPLYNEILP